jgi:hypothetical protein
MNIDKITEFLEEMIDLLTFTRVALLFILISVSIGMLAIFENRAAVFTTIYQSAAEKTYDPWVLSDQSKKVLVNLTDDPLIGGLILTDVDLKKNQRMTKFFYVKDKAVQHFVAPIVTGALPQPLFDRGQKNTEQMVAMLNNEFKCVPAVDTTTAKFVPGFDKMFSTVCRVAVPPFFGEFIGYLSIGLVRPLKDNEYDALRIEATRIAVEIYMRDVERKQI